MDTYITSSPFDTLLHKDEKMLQALKPVFNAYFFSRLMLSYFAGFIFGVVLLIYFINLEMQHFAVQSAYFIPLFIFLWCLPKLLKTIANYRHTLYGFSNDRIFFCTGIFSKNMVAFDYNKIKTIVIDEAAGTWVNNPGTIRFYLKYTEKIDNTYESIVYEWLSVAHCAEVKRALQTQLDNYVRKHGDEFVPNDEERKILELEASMERLEKTLDKLGKKEKDDFDFLEPSKDKTDFSEHIQWLTCDICGYEAISAKDEECQICFSESFEKENDEGDYKDKQEWLVSEQLDYFSDHDSKQNIFYKPKVLRGFVKSETWKPAITFQDILNNRKGKI